MITDTLSAGQCNAGETGSTAEAGYHVEGTLRVSMYRFEDQVIEFEVDVFGDMWRVKTLRKDDPSGNYWWEHFCDGRNVLELFRHSGYLKAQKGIPAQVHLDGYPAVDYQCDIPWLAFASGAFFKERGTLPAAWLRPRMDLLAHAFETKVVCLPGPAGLPERVDYLPSRALAKAAFDNPMLYRESVSREALAQRRQTARELPAEVGTLPTAGYEVTGATNLQKFVLPVGFRFQVRSTRVGSNRVVASFSGVVSKISLLSEPIPPPQAEYPLSIGDKRFRVPSKGIDSIQYVTTNTTVRDTDDPELARMLVEKKKLPKFNRT